MVSFMKKINNVNDINIYYSYKVVFKDYYYDYDSEEYFELIYSQIDGFKLGIELDEMLIDINTGKQFKFANDKLNTGDTYINADPLCKLNYFYNDELKNIELDKKIIVASFETIKKDAGLDRYIKVLRDNKYYIISTPCNLEDKILVDYYNDNEEELYDEYKTYRKKRLFM